MRCNRTQVFFLAEENMPPLAFLPACWQQRRRVWRRRTLLRRFFLKLSALIRLTWAISSHRRWSKPSDGSTKDPKPLLWDW